MPKQPSIEQQTLRKITTEEKAAAKVEVDRLATEAKTAIDQATDSQGVITAKENGVNAINNVSTDSVAKVDAKAEVDRLATEAKTAIDQATDAQGVETAKNTGVTDINNVSTDSTAKADAKAAIDEAANAKKAAIDSSDLTAEEKVAAKAEVDRLATEAKTAIDQATDSQGVTTAKENGVNAINNVSTDSAAKV